MNRTLHLIALLAVMLGAVSALGCTPKIGDDCSSSTDCSLRGDRLCDTTQPGGYCTVFNCEPGTCPDEAQCVAFDSTLDPLCSEPYATPRFQRTFCLKRCKSNGDCRGGYTCLDTGAQPNAWGAVVVDNDPEGRKVCVAASSEQLPSSGPTDTCRPYDGGFPDVAYFEPDVTENIDVAAPDATLDATQDATLETSVDAEEPDASLDVEAGE
jgi:hypothetical protein